MRFLTTPEIDGIGIYAFPIDVLVSPDPLLERPVGQDDGLRVLTQTDLLQSPLWVLPDLAAPKREVRFALINGHRQRGAARPISAANIGLAQTDASDIG
jgi:hypothetical protein